jgi:Flp pilus assembly protein TadB
MTDQARMTGQASQRADTATRPLQADKSLGELFGELTADMGLLFRQEVQLAKTEARADLKKGGAAAGMLGAAGVAGWLALLFVSLALAWLLDQAMNRALAFVIVGVVWLIVALVLMQRGKRLMKSVTPLPNTVETIKEDVQWAKEQRS